MTDVHQARIEAAAKALWERAMWEGDPTWADLDYGTKEKWRKDAAAAALAAADAVVTVDQIAEVVAEISAEQQNQRLRPDDSVWIPSDFNLDAREVAAAIQRLYRGEAEA